MSLSAGLIGKVVVAVVGAGVGGMGAYNFASTGCVLGGCGDKGDALDSTVLVSAETGGSCCSGETAAITTVAAGDSCESSCSGEAASIMTVAAGDSCESSCSSEAAAMTTVAASECSEPCEGDCSGCTDCNGACDESAAIINISASSDEACPLGCGADKAAVIAATAGK